MHPQDLAQVAFRILAVYIGIVSVPAIASFGWTLTNRPDLFTSALLAGLVMLVVPISIAILLWVMAPRLAMLAARESAAVDNEPRLAPRDLTRSGLILVGVYFFASSFPTLLAQLLTLADEDSDTPTLYIVQLAISCILAVALVLGADRIAALVGSIRYAGRSK